MTPIRIAVCVKHVPDATGDRRFAADQTVDRESVSGLLSELDGYAIEAALQIREARGGDLDETPITVVTVGPEGARDAIKSALQMGADAGVHVVDDSVHGSDAIATSLVLAKALERLGFDLALCGMASTDGGTSMVPAMLAERLGAAQVTFASSVEVDDTTIRARRDGDTATETIEATLPVVLSVTDQANEPRYPSLKGIMAAKKKPVETLTIADLGIASSEVGAAAAWTVVDGIEARPPRSAGTIVPDDGTGAEQLVAFLAAGKFI